MPNKDVEKAKAACTFGVWPFRFHFRAEDVIFFPAEKAANILRGAFGSLFRKLACVPECEKAHACAFADTCPYAHIFEPRRERASQAGPSGFADWPRPFVLRAVHLNGCQIAQGQPFYFDLILFEPPEKVLPYFVLTFRELVRSGLGPGRGRATLLTVEGLATHSTLYAGQRFTGLSPQGIHFDLASTVVDAPSHIGIQFLTPTELKAQGELVDHPEFAVLFSRLRDRISNLRACYQGGQLDIDFESLGQFARQIRLTSSSLHRIEAVRQSSRTGQRHPIGGFVGNVEYEGDFRPLMSFLNAGQWTGVGRQTVWGKGALRLCTQPTAGHVSNAEAEQMPTHAESPAVQPLDQDASPRRPEQEGSAASDSPSRSA